MPTALAQVPLPGRYMGHDPIEALVERENEKQRLVIESNHRVRLP